MNIARTFRVVVAALALATGGCRLFSSDHALAPGLSPLKPALASPDSVSMEIIWARFPANDPVLGDAAWREIDETQIEPAIRRELTNNGLRAGVISGIMPPALQKVLRQGTSADTSSASAGAAGSQSPLNATDLLTEPIIHGRKRRARRNQRIEIQASEVFASLPLLVNGGTELGGRTYQQAQAIYALRVDPRPDRTATLELTPELHHGAPRIRYTGEGGVMHQDFLKDREVFDRLRVTVKLAPGEMLVLMGLPDAGSRLGHCFHTVDSADGRQQKLILVRLAEVPPSDTFAVEETE